MSGVYLCEYTQHFAIAHLEATQVRAISIDRAAFNFSTEMWERRVFRLPFFNGDHVILTPRDILTRDETWINRHDLIDRFEEIPVAIPDAALRAAIMNYFWKELTHRRSTGKPATSEERAQAVAGTVRTYPELVDYYIRLKEDQGGDAISRSAEKVTTTEIIFSKRLREILLPILEQTEFFKQCPSTYTETWARLAYLKHVIEDRGGWRVFYHKGRPIERELDLQILFRLVWFGTTADASSEANDGRGPVDFKISRGREKTLVEFKLASNRKLEFNLQHQIAIYQTSSDAQTAIYAIIYFTEDQLTRVHAILKRLGRTGDKDILLIDARSDNKQSASIVAQP